MRISLLIILAFAALSINAQDTYIKKIASSSNLRINDGLIASDGNTIIVGGIVITPSSNYSPFIAKLDLNGDTIWTKSLPQSSLSSNFNNVEELNSTDLIVSGTYQNTANDHDPLIMKITTNGTIVYIKKIELKTATLDASMVSAGALQEPLLTSDGVNTYFAYAIINYENIPSAADIYTASINVIKLDFNLDTIWTNRIVFTPEIPGGSFNIMNNLNSIKLTNTGGILISHRLESGNLMEIAPNYITKLSNTGDLIKSTKIVPSGTSRTLSLAIITPLSNGNFLLSGSSEVALYSNAPNPVFLELDSNLNVLTPPTYFSTSGTITELQVFANGDFGMVLSNVNIPHPISGNLSGKVGIVRLDASLNPKWAIGYGYGSGNIKSLNEKSNGNLLGIGSMSYPYANGLLINADSSGFVPGCMSRIVNFSQNTFSFTASAPATYISTRDTVFQNTSPSILAADIYSEGIEIQYTDSIIQPLCKGLQGTIDLTINSNGAPYDYIWSNGSLVEDLTDLSGIYSVIIIDTWGCVQLDTIALIEPSIVEATYISTNVDCFGGANGEIDLTVSGGTPGYSFAWSTLNTTEDLVNLSGGFYQCVVSDTNGCNISIGISVAEPQQLSAVITSTINASCEGDCDGQLTGFAAGGTTPYTYLWNDPLMQTNDTAIGLCYGNYLFTVSDGNGCNSYSNATISEPNTLSASVTTWPSDCIASNGSAMVNPTGGSAPYAYSWDGATAVSNDSVGFLSVANYYVEVLDANGCITIEDFTIGSNTNPVEICVVTVDSNNQNLIVWEKPIASNIAGFKIFRNIAGIYSQVGYQPYDSISQFVDNDFGIDPEVTSYRYKIAVLDSCGNESALSNFHETIHLTASNGLGGVVNLIWDDYEGFPFSEYEIWRDTTGNGDWETINAVLSTSFTYVDNTVPASATALRYAIEVVMPQTCTAEKAQDHNSTRSNRHTIAAPNPNSMQELILSQASVYPNPNVGVFTINVKSTNWSYSLFDMSGKLISTEIVSETSKEIDVHAIETGIYLMKINLGDSFIYKKIIKQ